MMIFYTGDTISFVGFSLRRFIEMIGALSSTIVVPCLPRGFIGLSWEIFIFGFF